jgi:hypothetical protein
MTIVNTSVQETPTTSMVSMHMDLDSPRGLDVLFVREAQLAVESKVRRMKEDGLGDFIANLDYRSFSKVYDTVLYSEDSILEKAKAYVAKLREEYQVDQRRDTPYTFSVLDNPQNKWYYVMVHEVYHGDVNIVLLLSVRKDNSGSDIFVTAFGHDNLVESIEKDILQNLEKQGKENLDVSVVLALDPDPRMITKSIHKDDLDYPHIEFYPQLIAAGYNTIEEFEEEYNNSGKSLLMLFGKMGTGKTTLLSWLVFRAKTKNRCLIQHDAPIMSPKFGEFLLGHEGSLCVGIEDSDNSVLSSRETGNAQMSAILNFNDGALSLGNKMIISTNLDSMATIDSALPRKGRMFKTIRFGDLTPAQANNARKAVGLPEVDITKNITLAEALNFESGDNYINIDKAQNIGFIQ